MTGNHSFTLAASNRSLIVVAIVLATFCVVFGEAIFQDRNFIYRDAGHFYYPLLQYVADEWEAGRWPLWNPHENGGMPLLGNQAAAVLYPPRIVLFQWLPISYAAAFKWYTLLHVLWSAVTAYMMARNWRASELASGLAAISFAFGATVMFQYCNTIFLVGASWVPLGILAADRAVQAGSLRWASLLGGVLAMQMLGGDPQAAYVTGGLAALYVAIVDWEFAVTLALASGLWATAQWARPRHAGELQRLLWLVPIAVAVIAWEFRRIRRWRTSVGGPLGTLNRRRMAVLGVAAAVAAGLSAVQWLPTAEFARVTVRAAGGVHHEIYAFWIAPWRLAEMIWPNVSGHQFPQNTRWIDIFSVDDRVWEPSLYHGAVPFVLALAACGVRRATHWQRWMVLTLVLSIWAAAGPAGGPTWYLNAKDRRAMSQRPAYSAAPSRTNESGKTAGARRLRTELENPPGGLYWFLVQTLPGFNSFRYPAKLMTFAAVAIAALGAVGWDCLFGAGPSRIATVLAALLSATVLLTVAALVARPWLVDWLAQSPLTLGTPYFGPLLASRASWCIVAAFAQTAGVLALALAARWWSRRSAGGLAAACALALVAADLAIANRWMVSTAPQTVIDKETRAVEIIRRAEADDAPADRQSRPPFRVHRVSMWTPKSWHKTNSPVQDEEVLRWEKETIQPKYGLPHGVSYTINEGTMETFDYWFFFAPFYRTTPPNLAEQLQSIGHPPTPRVVYYPRRGYDMWNAKYFVLPKLLMAHEEHRGILTFLPNTQPVASSSATEDDFQVLRNQSYLPRAWIVHELKLRPPIRGLDRNDRQEIMENILYQGDELWFDPLLERTKFEPRRAAWVEVEPAEMRRVAPYHAPAADSTADHCEVVHYDPLRVELTARTAARGLLVLADVLLPGWKVTVDGKPQPIYRANRIMRGVCLDPGEHRIVFTYDPLSFRVGGYISLATILILATGAALAARRQVQRHGARSSALPR